MPELHWKLGVEIELLAPPGKSRRDYACALARHTGGSVSRYFHPQSELAALADTPVFHNLTLAYRVMDSEGRWVASVVDDLTLQADLRREARPVDGWYRILSDDKRLLSLVAAQADPDLPVESVLQPIARLFRTELVRGGGGMVKVQDSSGESVAIATPLPGERERPCEVVTAPMESGHRDTLEMFLSLARKEGFTTPHEGAIHLHFDGGPFRSASALASLVNIFAEKGAELRQRLGTNPHCRRLGEWPETLLTTVNAEGFLELTWPEAQRKLAGLGLTKYCDFNLRNLLRDDDFCTFEVRVLPVWLETMPLLKAAEQVESLLRLAVQQAT